MHIQSDGFVPGPLSSSQNNPPVLFNKTGRFCFSAEAVRCLNLMCLEVIADLVDGLGQNVRVFFPGINR
jgi:hypothetical protein